MVSESINHRAQLVLKLLISRYIRDGQPVGSKTLANDKNLSVSAATVRNVLSDLEQAGYLQAPHTSAGRIPTAKGYRLFVDSLLTVQPFSKEMLVTAQEQLNPDADKSTVLNKASQLLSRITRCASIVSLTKQPEKVLRHIEFLPLSGNRVLVILVINDKEVENRIIHTEQAYSASELLQAGNYLTEKFAGKGLSEMREALFTKLEHDWQHLDAMLKTTMDVAGKALVPQEEQQNYFISGRANLLELAEGYDVKKLKHLFETFTEKRALLHLLDQSIAAQGMQIFIGEEANHPALTDCSLITMPYDTGSGVLGVLGVIGPTRMAYDQVIPAVDVTSKLLSSVLNNRELPQS